MPLEWSFSRFCRKPRCFNPLRIAELLEVTLICVLQIIKINKENIYSGIKKNVLKLSYMYLQM